MPWLAIEKKYEFDRHKAKASLVDFEGRCQLIVYRAFFAPGVFPWPEHAYRGCSFRAGQAPKRHHSRVRLGRAATPRPQSSSGAQYGPLFVAPCQQSFDVRKKANPRSGQ
jgi:hypothetical protein